MTIYTGGLRQRLIADSVYHLIKDSITSLGWLNPSRPYRAMTIVTEAYPNDVEIPLNTIVISETVTTDDDAEMGSTLGEVVTTFYADFYAENEALAKNVTHDIRDILRGRMSAIGRTNNNLSVYDWSMATPPLIFTCDIEDVVVDQARDFPKPWQRFWWTCRFDVVDYYSGA